MPKRLQNNNKIFLLIFVENKYFIDTHPELSKEWDYSRNKGISKSDGEQITLKSITRGLNVYVWWKCPKSKYHTYKAQTRNRTNEKNLTGCLYCGSKKFR